MTQPIRQSSIAPADLEALQATMRGQLLSAAAPGYDEVRKVFNGTAEERRAVPSLDSVKVSMALSPAGTFP